MLLELIELKKVGALRDEKLKNWGLRPAHSHTALIWVYPQPRALNLLGNLLGKIVMSGTRGRAVMIAVS